MTEQTPDGLILLPRLRIENANAISGPLTWGFPAPSAFTGFVHALHRRLGREDIALDGAGIVCHRFEPQVYRGGGGYHYRFNLARHPMEKSGKPPGTVEEGRAHLEVSLLIGVYGDVDSEDGAELAAKIQQTAQGMRLAGGAIRPPIVEGKSQPPAEFHELTDSQAGDEQIFRKLRRRLLPGFALLNRHALFLEHIEQRRAEQPQFNALNALLELCALHVNPVADPEHPDKAVWRAARARPGWLVPLPVGYGAISPLHPPGTVRGARDEETPFRFVEALYTLGEWVSPHRIEHPLDMLWHHRADPDAGFYLCEHRDPNA